MEIKDQKIHKFCVRIVILPIDFVRDILLGIGRCGFSGTDGGVDFEGIP